MQAELQQLVGPKVQVTPDPGYIGVPTPASPARADVVNAVKAASLLIHGPASRISGDVDGRQRRSFFRAQGIPVYDVDGSWGISPDDEAPMASTSAFQSAPCTMTCSIGR